MATYNTQRFEFDLRVRRYGQKDFKPYDYPTDEEKAEEIVKEDLQYKALSAVEVIRKLLDYLY